MNDVAGRAVLLALVVCWLPLAAAGGAAAAPPEGAAHPATTGASPLAQAADNDTVRHQHPDEYDEAGDEAALAAWLETRLADRLDESAAALDDGEYERARESLDEEYRERLDQYVEVADESDGDGNRSAGEAYETAAENQRRLADLLAEYDETSAEYEAAAEAGDDARARELARELDALAREIAAASDAIALEYEVVRFETDADLDDAAETVTETNETVQRETLTIRSERFVETDLDVDADGERASLGEPLTVTGELRAADGSTPAVDAGRLEVAGEPVDVRTHDDGSFSFEYRPSPTTPLDTERVAVRYVPAAESTYLDGEASLPVSLAQVDGELTALDASDAVAYGDGLAVDATVTADGTPVEGAPLSVTLGDEPLGEVPAGEANATVPVPADVAAGDRTLRVAFAPEDRALGPVAAERTVTVEETATDLAVDARAEDDELAVTGTLTTADGAPVADRPVALAVDGAPAATATTDADGEFAERLARPADADAVTVRASFDGAGTNLAGASAEESVAAPGGGGPSRAWLAGGLVVAAGLGALAVVFWRRRGRVGDATAPATATPADPAPPDVDAATLLAAARDRLADDPDAAVRLAYAAARRACEPADADGALTHWEFYRRAAARDARLDEPLRALTETYERATYTPAAVAAADAERALDRARTVCAEADAAPAAPAA